MDFYSSHGFVPLSPFFPNSSGGVLPSKWPHATVSHKTLFLSPISITPVLDPISYRSQDFCSLGVMSSH